MTIVVMDGGQVIGRGNELRGQDGAPPLTWDYDLSNKAAAWAEHLIESGAFDHEPNIPYGQNMFGLGPGAQDANATALCIQATNDWYNEKDAYKSNPGDWQASGHYTQLVWDTTTSVGYGCAVDGNGRWVVVADFSPAGNMSGTFPDHVHPT